MNEIYGNNQLKFINASQLKLIAIISMAIDHIGALFFPFSILYRATGRIAFPIFAFQIAEGFEKTKDFKKYAERLFIFALISEIPFNIFVTSMLGNSEIIGPTSLAYQNVMFTLLFGLLSIKSIDNIFYKEGKTKVLSGILLCFILVLTSYFQSDYELQGVFTVIVFYLSKKARFPKLFQLLGLILIYQSLFKSWGFPISFGGINFVLEFQALGILSLIFIYLYNEKKGWNFKAFKYFSYWFYPVHLLILSFIYNFM